MVYEQNETLGEDSDMQGTMISMLSLALLAAAPAWAQPTGLTPNCQGAWQRYQAAVGRPKAFALAPGKSCGWWQNNDAARTLGDIRDKAVNQCRTSGGNEVCKLVDVQR
jgi:hypothetical protein